MYSSWWLAISHRNFERELSLTLLFLFPLLLVVMALRDAPKQNGGAQAVVRVEDTAPLALP